MSDEAAFLNAIRSRPDDDTIRLVYADWLEDRDDPRHEQVRAETAMRRVPVWSDEYQRLKPIRHRLRPDCPAGWLDALGYGTYRPLFTKLPPTSAERWRLAAEFIETWHGRPVEPGDGYTADELDAAEARIGRPLPRALREWYAFTGRRDDVWAKQDHTVPPSQLDLDERGDLRFRWENQGCTHWRVRGQDLGFDDPPVWNDDLSHAVSPTISAFMLLALFVEAKWQTSNGALEGSSGEEQERFLAEVHSFPGVARCDLPHWYWFEEPKELWEAEDVLIEEDPDGWYWIAPLTPAARARVEAHFTTLTTWYD